MRERLKKLLPIDGWSLAILLWTALFGVVMRGWRIVDFLWGTDDWSDLAWLPRSVGVDLAFAVLTYAACGLLLWPLHGARRSMRWLARLWALMVMGGVLFFGVANALSFHVSGSALTLHRLRGDDGATVRDMDKFAWTDVWPILLLAIASVLSLIAALALAGHFERWSGSVRRRVAGGVIVLGLASFSLYELVWDGRDRGYGRHPVGVFVESVEQEISERPAFLRDFKAPPMTEEGLAQLLVPERPQTPPPPTPTRAAQTTKNVIVFFSEGVPLKHTSLAPDGPHTTPRIKARAEREGLVFSRFYSPFHKSIQALFSLFCGDFPTPNGRSITELNPRIDCGELSEVMKKNGVRAGLFHGGYFSFYDKTALVGDRGYETYVDTPAIRATIPPPPGVEKWKENSWGIDDRATVRALLAWIDTLPKEDRFAAVMIPITAHYPFDVPQDVGMPFGDNRKIDRFWNAVSFLDLVFDELMQGLEERGLLEDTLVVFTADHGESPHEPPRESNVDRAAYEYDVHTPFVMFQRSMFPTPQHSERLAAIPDILPTIVDAMGLEDVRVRQGRSILSPDWQEKRIFIGAARSNVHLVGFIDGFDKFTLNTRTGWTELYDLKKDPDELTSIVRAHPERVARFTQTALTWSDWQYARIRDWPEVDEGVNVQMRLGADFDVRATDKSGRTVQCEKLPAAIGTARKCEGFPDDLVQGVTPMKFLGRTRMCMPIRIPPGGGSVELSVSDRDYFRFVTMMRFSFGAGREDTPGIINVTTIIDDKQLSSLNITKNWRNRRAMFGAPKRSLKVVVSANDTIAPAPLCLFFGDASFRPKPRALEEYYAATIEEVLGPGGLATDAPFAPQGDGEVDGEAVGEVDGARDEAADVPRDAPGERREDAQDTQDTQDTQDEGQAGRLDDGHDDIAPDTPEQAEPGGAPPH